MELKFKMAVHAACEALVAERIETVEDALKAAQDAANNETKSSAGDKYETGRAMMQLEKAKLSKQLDEALALRKDIKDLNPENVAEEIGQGSLVSAGTAMFYIAAAVGKMKVEGKEVFGISQVSPIGKKMRGLKVGDEFELNGRTWNILGVL